MEALKLFLSDDQILEIAEIAENGRKLEAIRLLQYYLIDKWSLTTIEAANIVDNIRLFFFA